MPFKIPFEFFSNKKPTAKQGEGVDFSALFDFLIKEISVPKNADNIINMAKQSGRKDSDDLLPTYVLFESYLCNFDSAGKYDRVSLRKAIGNRFPFLTHDPFFSILFLDEEQKKVKIGAFFIGQFLQFCVERFGKSKENFLEKKKLEFTKIFIDPGDEFTFANIEASCAELKQVIGDSWGHSLTGKIFEQAFQETAKRFKE